MAGHRPSTASLPWRQHGRAVGGARSPPRLEHARDVYYRRGRGGQAAGPAAHVPAVAKLLATIVDPAELSLADLRYTLRARPLSDRHGTLINTASTMCSLYCATRSRRPAPCASGIGTVRRRKRESVRIPQIWPTLAWTKSAAASPAARPARDGHTAWVHATIVKPESKLLFSNAA